MHTIQYGITRGEYLQMYRSAMASNKSLWLFPLAFGFVFANLFLVVGPLKEFGSAPVVVGVALTVALFMALLPLTPLLRFKLSLRSHAVDTHGLKVKVAKRSSLHAWREIQAIMDDHEEIRIVGKRFACIIPRRAFRNDVARRQFLHDAHRWHSTDRV